MRGKAISKFRSPNALPRAPTPLGTERVLHLRCVTRLTFVCMLRYSEWDAVPIWVPGFFGTYSGMVYWAGFRILQYLQWNIILTWFPNSSIFTMERYTELVSKFFNIYSGTLYWAGFRILQYLQWNVILIWFPNSSIFIMSRYSNPSSGLFGICAETLRRYSCPFTIPGQDAPRPLPSPLGFYLFSYRLEVSARGRGYRFGLLRRRGDTT